MIFLAHEDISVSTEWRKEILRRLRASEVFLALLTNAFDRSDWAHQEIGLAVAFNCVMVPIRVERKPVGFLASYQAIGLDEEDIPGTAGEIAESVTKQKRNLKRQVLSFLIGRLREVDTYDKAGEVAARILRIGGLNAKEINALLRAAAQNDQVYRSGSASKSLHPLIRKYRSRAQKGPLNRFNAVWAYR